MENNNNSSIKLSKHKHLDLFIILFFVTVAIATALITCSVLGVFENGTGYYALELADATGQVKYATGIECDLFFKGNGYEVNSKKKKATYLYNERMKYIYMQTSAYIDYSPYATGIAYINNNLDRDIIVTDTLYNILKDAYQKSLLDNNYSIFAAPIYHEWDILLYSGTLGEYDNDPLIYEEEKNYLNDLANIVNDTNNYSLLFKDNNTVNLSISETYREFREIHEMDSPIISLNVLENAYQMNYVSQELEKEGYKNGYLIDEYGSGITLSNFSSLNLELFNITDDESQSYGYLEEKGSYVFSFNHHFLATSKQIGTCYTLEHEEEYYYRSSYIDLNNGLSSDYYLFTGLISKQASLLDVVLENQSIAVIDDTIEENEYLNNLDDRYQICLLKKNDGKTLKVSESLINDLTIYKNDYTIVII